MTSTDELTEIHHAAQLGVEEKTVRNEIMQ
jgi:hypothetical protein